MNNPRPFPGAQVTVCCSGRSRRFASFAAAFKYVGFLVLLGRAEREFSRWVFGL